MATLLATSLLSDATARFALMGMATGALTGLVALGIVLVYRASGVLNFAAGALGAVGAFVCYELRDVHSVPAPLAVAAGLAVGVAAGLVTFGAVALLREASRLTQLIATLALFSAVQGFIALVWDTSEVRQPRSLLPDDAVTLPGDVLIGQDRLLLIGLVIFLALLLRFVYSRTLFGLATTAVAENRRFAAAAGWSTATIQLVNFLVAGVLSATAAILLAPILTLHAGVLSTAVLPALAAALVGRFSSFGLTVVAALGIGIAQSELSLFQPELADALGVSVPSLIGLAQAVPLLIILAVVVFGGRARPARGETAARLPLPGSGSVSVLPAVVGVLVAIRLATTSDTWADAVVTTCGIGIVVCSVVVVTGYAGQLSLCQFALAGFGAWIAARLVATQGMRFEVAVIVATLGAVLVGAVVALPALRTRGANLGIATLALALMFDAVVFSNGALTGGFEGTVVTPPRVFGATFDPIEDPDRYALFVLAAFVGCGLAVANLRRGRSGRRLLAVRSNERAAASLGISIVGAKLYAFAVAAGIAAVGGILLAFRQRNVQFQAFDVFGSILSVQYAVIGGLGWVAGAMLGAATAPGAIADRFLKGQLPGVDNIAAWLALLAGVGAINILRTSPDGLGALWSRIAGRAVAFARLPRRREVAVVDGPRRRPASLVMEGVTVGFGGVTALRGVDLEVHPGEVVGLIGPNGAGKTTLLDVATGFTPAQAGAVRLDGAVIDAWAPERRAAAGVARSWQAVELFEEMTVRENLMVAVDDHRPWRYVADLLRPGRPRLTRQAVEIIEELGLADVLDSRPSALPQGIARLAGIARAMVGDPRVLLLDEPAAGLDRAETAELAQLIRGIADRRGLGVLVVEHDVPMLLRTCDRIAVLDFGDKIAEGTPADIRAHRRVAEAYLGSGAVADPRSEVLT
jgi:ABC-type branched-subunit amino acid transport system ATPase component/ABC-type branched-subunit amino acid transport system permease subunit